MTSSSPPRPNVGIDLSTVGRMLSFRKELHLACSKFMIVVALAILFAQPQCVAGCSGRPCFDDVGQTDSIPPCHQHHSHTHDHGSGSCAHHVLISSASLPHSVQTGFANLSTTEFPASAHALVPSWQFLAHGSFRALPPTLHVPSVSVLRI
jgi:hypothetical protein